MIVAYDNKSKRFERSAGCADIFVLPHDRFTAAI
jgi:hypothetical protein